MRILDIWQMSSVSRHRITRVSVSSLVAVYAVVHIGACATPNLRVSSNPDGAEVSLTYGADSTETVVGKTPLDVDNRFLQTDRGDYVRLTVKKSGYRTESIVLPTSRMQSAVSLAVTMKETTIPQECLALDETTERVAKTVAAAQSLIQSKNYDLAERQLVNLQSEFPSVSVVYDLLGNISYIKRDFPQALRFYKKSLSLSPGSPETARMVEKLSRIGGQRMPAEEER